MLKAILPATLLLTLIGGLAHAGDPREVVSGIYAEYPWMDLPPGGHGAWHQETAAIWGAGSAEAGKAFLVGTRAFTEVYTEIIESGEYEARVRTTLSDSKGPVHILIFGMLGDDDEDDRWRVIEVIAEDGKRLSDVITQE